MLNLFSFFKQQAAEWRRDNSGRPAEYVAGGVAALREACDELTSQKDVVDLEWVTNQLNASEKEARELRTLNRAFDEARRTYQSKSDRQAHQLTSLQAQLAARPPAAAGKQKKAAELGSEVGSLRHRIKELEAQLSQAAYPPLPEVVNLNQRVLQLRAELDKVKGIGRVGPHVTSLPQVLKAIRRVLKYENHSLEQRLLFIQQVVDTSQGVLEGREPHDFGDPNYALALADELNATPRGAGGFGSTGL